MTTVDVYRTAAIIYETKNSPTKVRPLAIGELSISWLVPRQRIAAFQEQTMA